MSSHQFFFTSLLLRKLQKLFLNLYFLSLTCPIVHSCWNSWSFPCHHLIQNHVTQCLHKQNLVVGHRFIPFCLNLFTSLYPLFILLLVHTFYSSPFYVLSQRPSFLNNTVNLSSLFQPFLNPMKT